MPRVAKLNGESPATQPREDELAGEYRARLAEELGVKPECVGLLGGRAAVPNSAELSRFSSEEVLQVVVCPPEETISGWTVRMLLNELCVDGTRRPDTSLLDERLAAIEILQAQELKDAIQIITSRALDEPKYYKQCADVVVALNARWPELPSEPGEGSGEAAGEASGEGEGEAKAKAKTFKGELFNSLTKNFGVLRNSKPPDEKGDEAEHRERALALMAFFGQLFVRQVVNMDGLNLAAFDLVGRDDNSPGDHQMDLAVQLLTVAGPSLDAVGGGRPVMTHWLDRIFEIASWSEENGANLFSQPVLLKAEELIKLRRNNWGKALSGFA